MRAHSPLPLILLCFFYMYAQSLDLAVLLLWGSPLPFGFVGFWIPWWNPKAFGAGSHIISMIWRNLKKKICKCQKVVKNFIPAFKKWQTKLGNRTRIGDRSSLSQVILVHCAEKQIGIESFFFQLIPHILEQLIFLGQYCSWDKEEETGHSIFFTISVISLSTKKKNLLFQPLVNSESQPVRRYCFLKHCCIYVHVRFWVNLNLV